MILTNKSRIEATFKSRDTEEILDVLFYRPIGYIFALASKSVGLTPNIVTFISILFGVTAGHLFFYPNLTLNLIGVLLLIIAEALDSADGQLARMTNNKSRYGRIFDGVAGNLMFISIYIHLSIRYIIEGGTPWIFLIAIISGLSHSFQSAMSDYYRNFYLFFILGENKGGIDELEDIKKNYSQLSWSKNIIQKTLLRLYINYTVQQKALSKSVLELFRFVNNNFQGVVPIWLQKEYRAVNKPMLKYGNILTTNTRMMVLFLSLFFGNVLHYFLFELIVLNLLLVYFVIKEEKISLYLLDFTQNRGEDK